MLHTLIEAAGPHMLTRRQQATRSTRDTLNDARRTRAESSSQTCILIVVRDSAKCKEPRLNVSVRGLTLGPIGQYDGCLELGEDCLQM
jgi:hypothetical protein